MDAAKNLVLHVEFFLTFEIKKYPCIYNRIFAAKG